MGYVRASLTHFLEWMYILLPPVQKMEDLVYKTCDSCLVQDFLIRYANDEPHLFLSFVCVKQVIPA